tara:strand:+ start:17492 stop:17767 length:276 start_codon:yes stop_codon:yes gene_type:complete
VTTVGNQVAVVGERSPGRRRLFFIDEFLVTKLRSWRSGGILKSVNWITGFEPVDISVAVVDQWGLRDERRRGTFFSAGFYSCSMRTEECQV